MADRIVEMGPGFWNVRGSFKIGGIVEIGTQTSLAKLSNGKFVLLDAYTFDQATEDKIRALTDGGDAIEAVIHLHPFHTIHVERIAEKFPGAKQYGTERHIKRAPEVAWEAWRSDSAELHEHYADDFIFTVPAGVELIPSDEKLHFSSVIAIHKASRTMHVDDTLTWADVPLVGGLLFHPTLKWVLEPREGAASDFRGWVDELIELCSEVDNLATAHARKLAPGAVGGDIDLPALVRKAYSKVASTVDKHEKKYG